MSGGSSPGPARPWRNWYRSTIETLDWTRIAARNHLIKLRHLQGCCGNHGQPGC